MAMVPVEILDLRRHPDAPPITSVLKAANEIQSDFLFSLIAGSKAAQLSISVYNDADGGDLLNRMNRLRYEWMGHHPFLICLTDSNLSLDGATNLFSVDSSASGLAVISTNNVGGVLLPDETAVSYIVFQLAFFSLKFVGGNLAFHEEDRGCIFDYRENKIGIVVAITGGSICDSCKKELEANHRISPDHLASVFAILRFASLCMQSPEGLMSAHKPKIFVGSSLEGLEQAQAVQSELDHDYDVEIWNQSGVFGLGTSNLEALEEAVSEYDFAIFIFTPDDRIEVRGSESHAARDNVIFESGLFIGKLGRFRSFILKPRGIKMQMPTDLSGIATADYDPSKTNIVAAVGAACSKIRAAISKQLLK